jgi:hypothetical protein
MEDRLHVNGISLNDTKILQAETGSNRPSGDETQTAGVQRDHVSVRVDRGVEVGDEAVTAANIKDVGGCEVQIGDGREIRLERILPPPW